MILVYRLAVFEKYIYILFVRIIFVNFQLFQLQGHSGAAETTLEAAFGVSQYQIRFLTFRCKLIKSYRIYTFSANAIFTVN